MCFLIWLFVVHLSVCQLTSCHLSTWLFVTWLSVSLLLVTFACRRLGDLGQLRSKEGAGWAPSNGVQSGPSPITGQRHTDVALGWPQHGQVVLEGPWQQRRAFGRACSAPPRQNGGCKPCRRCRSYRQSSRPEGQTLSSPGHRWVSAPSASSIQPWPLWPTAGHHCPRQREHSRRLGGPGDRQEQWGTGWHVVDVNVLRGGVAGTYWIAHNWHPRQPKSGPKCPISRRKARPRRPLCTWHQSPGSPTSASAGCSTGQHRNGPLLSEPVRLHGRHHQVCSCRSSSPWQPYRSSS